MPTEPNIGLTQTVDMFILTTQARSSMQGTGRPPLERTFDEKDTLEVTRGQSLHPEESTKENQPKIQK